MSNKVFFGLSNVYFALVTFDSNGTPTFGVPHKHPGAVNLTLEVAGSVTPFYADNIVYYQATANQGYTGSMEFARYDEWFRMNVLKEIKDEAGVLVENAAVQPAPVAMLYQVEGDEKQAKRVLYYVQVERPNETSATIGESTEPQTATANITVMPLPNTQDVKAHTTDDTDPEVYANWFSEVHVRSGEFTPDATLKALSLGTVSLEPVFSSATKKYTATTTNATNTISAVATLASSTIAITNNGKPAANGSPITWDSGKNTVLIKVTNGSASETYTITVTKS